MAKGPSRKKIGRQMSQTDSYSTKIKMTKSQHGAHRKMRAKFNEIRKQLYSHNYWSVLALRDAVLTWTNYKADTVIGTELHLQAHTRDAYGVPLGTSNTVRPIWSIAGRKLSDTEVYRIAENICGYSPGNELFPDHLTREEALLFIEVTEMIQEAWESMKHSFMHAAENREQRINKHYSTNQKDRNKKVARKSAYDPICFQQVGALEGKKGELIYNWLSICDARKGCYACYKAAELHRLTDTERLIFLTRNRDEAVTSFQMIQKLTSRLKQLLEQAAKGSKTITFDDGHVFDQAAFNKKYADFEWDKYTDVVTSPGAMYRLVSTSVCTHYNKKYGEIETAKLRRLGYGLRLEIIEMRTDVRDFYKPLYDVLNYILVGLDSKIYPKLILPEDCGCDNCEGKDFLTDPNLVWDETQ